MAVTLPAGPPALPADTYAARHRAWWEQCDVLLRQEDQRQRDESEANRLLAIAASQAHGAAQQATAVAMQANVAAQNAMVAELNAPHPAPTDAQLLRDFMHSYVAAGAQDGQIAALAKARLAEFKAATAPIFSAP